jgi:UDP-N-acetylglucosamine--N-acetylmuramyl-(pentapeptide) pyrophosphoryl-undecaprenol N-acetylglucosamine transferase
VINLIRKEKIDAMIGFGGFITVPPAIAFKIMMKPIFTHEQNSIQGSANRMLSKHSTFNFLGFPIKNNLKNNIFSGNPIRNVFSKKPAQDINSSNDINIYVTGGSQGAEYLNKNLPKVFGQINCKINIKHQCGVGKLSDVKTLYLEANIDAEVQEFYKNPQSLIEWSDFVITRSGALSISEISSMGRGMVMVPLPSSIDNHQFYNAKYIENIGMGIVHSQENGLSDLEIKLSQVIDKKIYNDWKSKTNLEHLNAASFISSKIIEYLSK